MKDIEHGLRITIRELNQINEKLEYLTTVASVVLGAILGPLAFWVIVILKELL